jgi:hypothetical protein
MKALLAALILAASPLTLADQSPTPVITGVIGYAVDGQLMDLGMISEVRPDDCAAVPECKAEIEQLVKIKHVKLINVRTGTKV